LGEDVCLIVLDRDVTSLSFVVLEHCSIVAHDYPSYSPTSSMSVLVWLGARGKHEWVPGIRYDIGCGRLTFEGDIVGLKT